MAGSFKDKRVLFKNTASRDRFFVVVQKNINLSWAAIAKTVHMSERTLTDWKRGASTIPYSSLKALSKISNISIPHTSISIKKSLWWIPQASHKGGIANFQKNGGIGNKEYREERWRNWYDTVGYAKLNNRFVSLEVFLPSKSAELAEFIGILLGDGTLTTYYLSITLNIKTDLLYAKFIVRLCKRLFRLQPTIYLRPKHSVRIITIARKQISDFMVSCGLFKGNKIKNKVDIPGWIIKNKKYRIACMRGLMDTDGCIYEERHFIKKTTYCYPRMSFVSMSEPLRCSVFNILTSIGLTPKFRNNRSVQLEKRADIVKYFKQVGTSNPKHQARYAKFIGGIG